MEIQSSPSDKTRVPRTLYEQDSVIMLGTEDVVFFPRFGPKHGNFTHTRKENSTRGLLHLNTFRYFNDYKKKASLCTPMMF